MSEQRVDEAVFSVVSTTPAQLRRLLEALPSSMLDADLDAGWSPKHVVAHVLDTEDVIVGRMQRIVREERPFIASIDATARLNDGGYLQRDLESLLGEFETRRAEGVEWLHSTPLSQLQRWGDHDEAGPMTALDHAHQWAYHDLMHLTQ